MFNNPNNIVTNESGFSDFKPDIYWKFFYPNKTFYNFIIESYSKPNDFNLEVIKSMPLENEINFYKFRNEKVNTILNMEYPEGSYTQKEKDFGYLKIRI